MAKTPQTLTFGQVMLADILPSDVYQPGMKLDKGGLKQILGQVAQQYPDQYGDIAYGLMRLGLRAGESTGGASFGVKDLSVARVAAARNAKIQQEVRHILDTVPDPKERRAKIIHVLTSQVAQHRDDVLKESEEDGNAFALQLKGAGRGNKTSLTTLRGGDLVVGDASGNPVPVPLTRSYTQGLTPAQYFAASFGARQGITTTKLCLSGDTLVQMVDGTQKPIRDISPGELVFGADTRGRLRPVRVVNKFDNGNRECYRTVFRHGSCYNHFVSLDATLDHKILAANRQTWSPYADERYEPAMRKLAEGRVFRNPRKHTFVAIPGRGIAARATFGRKDVPESLIAGLMLGDGCMAESARTFQLSCADPSLIEQVNPELLAFGMELVCSGKYSHSLRMLPELAAAFYSRRTKGGVRIRGALTPLKRWLIRELGRKLAHEKQLPASVWRWNRRSLARLFAGIFSSDGCFLTKYGELQRFTLAMTAKPILEKVRQLLAVKFGVWASPVSLARAAGVANSVNDLWSFSVENPLCLARLQSEIGPYLVGVKRAQVLESCINLKYSEQFGRLLSMNKFGFKLYSRERLGQVATYDIEVDHPNHAFLLANGLIVSNSVASSGFLSKVLTQAAHRAVVVDNDDDAPRGQMRGYLVDTEDNDNVGALLAQPIGGYDRNTIITPKILADLQDRGLDQIIVRSPIASSHIASGVYAKDLGVREYGRLPQIGETVGIVSGNAIGEQVTQASLGAKHGSGRLGAKGQQTPGLSGFGLVEKLVNPAAEIRGLAVHSQLDGRVNKIREAPQGGLLVTVGEEEHYVAPGFTPSIKVGDVVEAGDTLTDGMPNPAEITRHKGIGEGRAYFVSTLRRGLKEAGFPVDRRNIEVLSRGLIDRVRTTEEFGDYLPDQVVPYSQLERLYEAREDARKAGPSDWNNRYLEEPVLHYTIGTRITPSIAKTLGKVGIRDLLVHDKPPPFQPEVVRGMDVLQSDPDWMTRFLGSHLTKGFLQGVHYGAESDTHSTSFVPSRAEGQDFGKTPLQLGKPLKEDFTLKARP